MNAIEILKARLPNGNKLQGELVYDPDPEATNPRELDNLGTILIAPNKSHWVANRDDVIDISIPLGKNPHEHWENIRREQLKFKKSDIAIAYPVTKYEHGAISLSLGYKSGWDCGVVGFIYVTKEQVRECYGGVKRITKGILEHAKNCMQSELDTLTSWLNGEVYGWEIKEYALDDDGLDWEEVDTIDSCWGYLDQAQALGDLADMLNHYTQNQCEEV